MTVQSPTFRTGALRTLLACLAVIGGMGMLSEWPLRWFVRAGLTAAGVAAGVAFLVLDQPAGRRWARLDVGHFLRRACWLLLWCEVATLGLRFLRLNALPYFSWEPAFFKTMWPRRVVVVSHIAAGGLAMLLGPGQFWPAWRARVLAFHRRAGRLYVLAVGCSGLFALYLAWFISPEEGGHVTGFSMSVLALVWMTATALGWRRAVARQFDSHREWMFRSYLLTLVFITLRWPLSLPWVQNLGPLHTMVPIVVWTAWVIPLGLAEFAIHRARALRQLRFV